MRRVAVLLTVLAALLGGLVFAGTAGAAPSKTYTVTKTFGPYNGEATWQNGKPGQVPDGEALSIGCNQARESIVGGSVKINRKTTHGMALRDVITTDVIGAYFDTDRALLKWGAFVNPTGKRGWNTATLTITCHR